MQYKRIYYSLNSATGYYTKSETQPERIPFMRTPYELRVAKTQSENIKSNATELIVSREMSKTNSYKFITGIQKTNFKNWFVGNDYEFIKNKKVLSLILFQFCEFNECLTVYYFSRYDKGSTDLRIKFANQTIQFLIQKHQFA
jgi:hypothetical protein